MLNLTLCRKKMAGPLHCITTKEHPEVADVVAQMAEVSGRKEGVAGVKFDAPCCPRCKRPSFVLFMDLCMC